MSRGRTDARSSPGRIPEKTVPFHSGKTFQLPGGAPTEQEVVSLRDAIYRAGRKSAVRENGFIIA